MRIIDNQTSLIMSLIWQISGACAVGVMGCTDCKCRIADVAAVRNESRATHDVKEMLSITEVKEAVLDFIKNSPEAKRAFILEARQFVEGRHVARDADKIVVNWGPWVIDRDSNYLRLDANRWSLEGYFVRSAGGVRLVRVNVYEVRGAIEATEN